MPVVIHAGYIHTWLPYYVPHITPRPTPVHIYMQPEKITNNFGLRPAVHATTNNNTEHRQRTGQRPRLSDTDMREVMESLI